MTKVLLIRHGQTVWNRGGKYQGHTDVQLSEEGREQARRLRQRFINDRIDAFYASDLSRAMETASIIAEGRGAPVVPVPALRELNFGVWEGLTYQEILAGYGYLAERWYIDPTGLAIPNGETFEELKERSYRVMQDLVARHPGQTILVVSHGGTIRAIICAVLDLDLKNIWSFRQDNTAVNIIDFYEQRAVLSLLNDTHHLNG